MRCSHQFKTYLVEKLLLIANDTADRRRAAAARELTVCYFSGFGVPLSFQESSRWLTVAVSNGIVAAQDYFKTVHEAMGIDPSSVGWSASDVNRSCSSMTTAFWEFARLLPPSDESLAGAVMEQSDNTDADSHLSESEDATVEQATSVAMPSRITRLDQ